MRHGSTHRGSGSFLTFPVSGGALLNLVAFVPTDLDVEESWSAPGDVAALAATYNGWAKQVRQVIEAMDHTFRWGIYDRAPLKTWSTDRITLLGDAAHAVTPQLGQGANQAVEDAITLAVLRLGKLVRPAALYAGPDARTPDTVEGWKDVNATSIRWP
jgi:salicylate hydroxylase